MLAPLFDRPRCISCAALSASRAQASSASPAHLLSSLLADQPWVLVWMAAHPYQDMARVRPRSWLRHWLLVEAPFQTSCCSLLSDVDEQEMPHLPKSKPSHHCCWPCHLHVASCSCLCMATVVWQTLQHHSQPVAGLHSSAWNLWLLQLVFLPSLFRPCCYCLAGVACCLAEVPLQVMDFPPLAWLLNFCLAPLQCLHVPPTWVGLQDRRSRCCQSRL
mmetsp:Transcript_59397/g.109874  ORF Transcript_59397/g.109874 Transcript_59397/m.109874 type:complete len:218 (-) Transcript_59397:1083-1736(-)